MNKPSATMQQAATAIRNGRFEAAIKLLKGLLAGQPGDLQARWMLLQALEASGQRGVVLAEVKTLLLHARKELAGIDQVAAYLLQRRFPLKYALRAYEKYLSAHPNSVNAAFNLAWYLGKDGQFEAAIAKYRFTLLLGIDTPEEVHLNIANICMDHLHDHAAAKEHLQNALELNSAYGSAYYNLGNLAEQEGARDEAKRCFEKCLELEPANESALARLADTRVFRDADDPLLEKLTTAAPGSRNADLQFAAGKAFEQLGEFDMAWRHFTRGNELDRPNFPTYHMQQAEERLHGIGRQCDAAWLEKFTGKSHPAVFICGMFRTGSTLLEQILAAHPAFQAGGESEFFPRLVAREFPQYPAGLAKLDPKQARAWMQEHRKQAAGIFGESLKLTDKRPDNFLHLGLIRAVLPSAKFIVTERDWRDTATSIFSARLGSSQNYATTLRHIRHYIGLQAELVDHWASVLGPDLIRVRYEDIVRSPRETVGNLLYWLGEEWDDACLEFHGLRNTVKTASVWQVRQPLHDKSVGRWCNYEKQFRQVFGDDL